MIKSQVKTIRNLNENSHKRKFDNSQIQNSKQNHSLSPCLSARYHEGISHNKLKRELSEQKDRLNKSQINLKEFIKQDEKKMNVFNSQLQQITQKCSTIKTQGNDEKSVKYGKLCRIRDIHKVQPNILRQQNKKQSLNELVRKHVESHFQGKIMQQNLQQSIVIPKDSERQKSVESKDNMFEISKKNRTKQLSEKKIELKIKQKNIDNMNNQIYALLDYVKYGRKHVIDEINNYDKKFNGSNAKRQLQPKQTLENNQQVQDQTTPNINVLKPIQSKLQLNIDLKKLVKKRRYLQAQSKTSQQNKYTNLNATNTKENIQQFQLYSQRSNSNRMSALLHDFNNNLKTNAYLNNTYNNNRVHHQNKNKYTNFNESQQNSICTQDSNISLINSKIDKIKQRIQYSQEVTKTLQSKYLQNNAMNVQSNQNKIQSERQANRKLRNQTMLQNKIDKIKQQIYENQFKQQSKLQNKNHRKLLQNRMQKQQNYLQIAQYQPTSNILSLKNNNYQYQLDENSFNKKNPINCNKSQNIKINDYVNENKPKYRKPNNFSYDQIVLKFVQLLDEQVQIDKQFRHYRQLFSSLPASQLVNQKWNNRQINRYRKQQPLRDKWYKLHQKIMQSQSIYSYSIDEVKQLIEISAGEGDPFWSASIQPKCNQQIIINRTVELFAKSDNHWKSKIVGFISESQMNSSGFGSQVLDFSKLGHICIEDLVCFINLHKNTLYRNRDLLPIFKRFCQANNIDYKLNRINYEDVENVLVYRH